MITFSSLAQFRAMRESAVPPMVSFNAAGNGLKAGTSLLNTMTAATRKSDNEAIGFFMLLAWINLARQHTPELFAPSGPL